MSHAVEKMMFTGSKPWWYGNSMQGDAIGVDLSAEGAVNSARAITEAGLDWLVVKRQAGYFDPQTQSWVSSGKDRFLVRESDGSIYGKCTEDYQDFQNHEGFAFLDRFAQDGQMLYHTAGSLEGGKRVWMLAQLPDSWTVVRRSGTVSKHHAFLNLVMPHGDGSINLMPTDVCVVCANTAGFADRKAEGENLVYRIPHRGDINAKLELAALAIKETLAESDERRRVLQAMAQTAMTTDEFVDFATSIFLGLDGDKFEVEAAIADFYETATPRSKTIMENKVADVTARFVRGIGNEGESAYDAQQAFTEHFDHFDLSHIKDKIEKGKRAAKAVQSSWIGAGAQRKALVFKRLQQKLG